ncbi:hypothetical protein Tb927.4.2810 [Trypanosoma brucei brucei TREU927]|uniref:Uncharacterized protein n=1 Tax=Trypanosoma brucei brucei (strain 927/4 GUTat10.1) TaxID=185431 RepID=Q583V8_TRYB2|nr:hypothetical protein Tb927.4.2810 [Trypanosoma brucei brucei TREU927]AAX79855.1 hypothetical protein Tb927.4.2810 [Trypanosoma brucei]AAZ10872.1 hypothetical protein Tb927.4.2810 [Trypanosoma brucei brucei TREU927]
MHRVITILSGYTRFFFLEKDVKIPSCIHPFRVRLEVFLHVPVFPSSLFIRFFLPFILRLALLSSVRRGLASKTSMGSHESTTLFFFSSCRLSFPPLLNSLSFSYLTFYFSFYGVAACSFICFVLGKRRVEGRISHENFFEYLLLTFFFKSFPHLVDPLVVNNYQPAFVCVWRCCDELESRTRERWKVGQLQLHPSAASFSCCLFVAVVVLVVVVVLCFPVPFPTCFPFAVFVVSHHRNYRRCFYLLYTSIGRGPMHPLEFWLMSE